MRKEHLLSLFSLIALLALVLAACNTPTPQATVSPLQSPVETPVPVSTPSECPNGCLNPTVNCVIKGIVTGMGDRYYYTPDMPGYEEAQMYIPYGMRWFCNEEDAIRNGWQRAPGQ